MRHDTNRTDRRILLVLLGAGVLIPTSVTVAETNYRIIALTGDDAPGTNATLFDLGTPQISTGNQVAFFAELDDGDFALYRSVYDDPATLELIVRTGDAVPGGPGNATFLGTWSQNFILINAGGNLGFSTTVAGLNEQYDGGVFRFRDGVLETVALPGQQVPGLAAGVEFKSLTGPSMNSQDSMAFGAYFQGTGVNSDNDEAMLAHGFGGLHVVVREGWSAPGRPGDDFGSFGLMNIADNGRLAFWSALNNDLNYGSIWTGWPGLLSTTMVAGEGNPNVGGFMSFSLSNDGIGIASAAPLGFHRDLGGGVQTAVAVGGAGPLGTYADLDEFQGRLNAYGTIHFAARFNGPAADADTALVQVAPNGQQTIVVRENDPALGYWNGVEIADLTTQNPTLVVADDAGRVYYKVPLRGSAITAANDAVLYARDLDGTTEILLREGGLLDVGDGDYRIIETFFFMPGSGTQSGRRGAVTESGDIAIAVHFTDGSEAIVVAQLDLFCAGDFNNDGFIDTQDFLILLAHYGMSTPIGEDGDTDRNGFVDVNDLLDLLATWGVCA